MLNLCFIWQNNLIKRQMYYLSTYFCTDISIFNTIWYQNKFSHSSDSEVHYLWKNRTMKMIYSSANSPITRTHLETTPNVIEYLLRSLDNLTLRSLPAIMLIIEEKTVLGELFHILEQNKANLSPGISCLTDSTFKME